MFATIVILCCFMIMTIYQSQKYGGGNFYMRIAAIWATVTTQVTMQNTTYCNLQTQGTYARCLHVLVMCGAHGVDFVAVRKKIVD